MNPQSPLSGWESLQAGLLFRDLPAWLNRSTGWLMTAAFLLVVAGHLWRMHGTPSISRRVASEWYLTLLVVAFVLASPVFARWAFEASEAFQEGVPGDTPSQVTRRCLRLASTYPGYDQGWETASTEASDVATELARDDWETHVEEVWTETMPFEQRERWLKEGEASEAHRVATETWVGQKAQGLFVSQLVTVSSLVAAGAVAWLMDTLRFLFVTVGMWLAPLAVAALRVAWLRAAAERFFLWSLAVLLWPFLWKAGHQGTQAIFDRWVAGYVGPGGNPEPLRWANIDGGDPSDLGASWLDRVGPGVPGDWLASTALGAFGFLLWICVVTILLPLVLHWLLAQGAGRVKAA